jgi:hypothetical protein
MPLRRPSPQPPIDGLSHTPDAAPQTSAHTKENIVEHSQKPAKPWILPSRRNFLAGAGAGAAAASLAGCSTTVATLPPISTYTDADMLNFALNLEYLEAEFYLRAATGSGLSAADAGSGAGSVNGGTKITGLTTFQQNVLDEFAYAEQQHVRYLRAALGSAAVSRPAIDFTNGFTAIATVANSLSSASATLPFLPIPFNPFSSFDAFMVAAAAIEDIGVSAYVNGAVLTSPAGIAAGYLSAASGILGTEAYHAAFFRNMLIQNAITQGYTAYQFPLYFNRLVAFITSITLITEIALGGYGTGADTVSNVGTSATADVDTTNSLGLRRSTDAVMHFVYATYSPSPGTVPTNGVTGGGLFPNGLNGEISITQS